ncbi:hypothetical protein J132_00547 [Termitomyces sp. J132]|nr:hypothetical protein H2248_009747 [Termitomyces sp. 'cryptogamus']KNZ81440.1 hypothetical protein J132_00547 [Termitomyces sp. J132]
MPSQDVIPTCATCKQSFCAAHRHPSSHSCSIQKSLSSKKVDAARALLSEHFPASSSRKTARRIPKAPTDLAKLAQWRKVELIKIRHRAIPGDFKEGLQSVPFEQRLHLRFINKGSGDEESILWFRKTMVAGKILDSLAIHAKIKSSEQLSLQLSKILDNGDTEVLLNDKAIGDQVEDGDRVTVTSILSSPSN